MSVARWVGGGKGAYRQRVRFDGQHAVLRAHCLYALCVGPEPLLRIAHHPGQHRLRRRRHSAAEAVEEGGGEGVVGAVVHDRRTGTRGGVDRYQKTVQMMGRRALRGVLGPALPHHVEESRRKSRCAGGERVRNLERQAFFNEGHQNRRVLGLKRHLAESQLPKDDADGIHVSAIICSDAVEQLGGRPLDCSLGGGGRLDADDGVEALDGGAEVAYLGDEVRGEHGVQALQVAVGDVALVEVVDGRGYFPRVPQADVRWGRRLLAERLVQTAATHPFHHVNGIQSVLARGDDDHAVGMAHTGINGELLDELAVVALRDGALQGGLHGDQHAVQQTLFNTTMRARSGGEARVDFQIAALDHFEAEFGMEWSAGADKRHVVESESKGQG